MTWENLGHLAPQTTGHTSLQTTKPSLSRKTRMNGIPNWSEYSDMVFWMFCILRQINTNILEESVALTSHSTMQVDVADPFEMLVPIHKV